MMPEPPRRWPPDFDAARIRHAAGLLLVYPIDDRPHIVLTVRAGTLGRHSGQVSLPGGAVDAGETLADAALREAREEIGLDAGGVRTIGALTPIDIPVSGFRLHPIVAVSADRPALQPAAGEVARILEIPVARLSAGDAVIVRQLTRDDAPIAIPTFVLDEVEIWGATAMVLAEFLEICNLRM
jgi:8-oxo-dGTP pyrophosphatase MutT (NUDIX family)